MHREVMIIVLGGLSCFAIVVHSLANTWLTSRKLIYGNPDAASLPGMSERLHRIELSLEALSLEVERNGEGQRYLVKLLGDRSPTFPVDRSREHITPH